MSARTVWIPVMILLAGCAQGPPRPVEIEDGDTCALCKMAISEQRYAAELIDGERRPFKFDDIGCLLRFGRERQLLNASGGQPHIFVRDYDRNVWLEAAAARYVRSAEIPSPMASGLIAVQDYSQAERAAAKFNGRILGFAEIWKP